MKRRERRMTAAEFFGGAVEKKVARPRSRKPAADDVFADIKVRMVMRIYGVSRAKALEIIAKREGETRAAEGEVADRSTADDRGGEFMSAAEFFGA